MPDERTRDRGTIASYVDQPALGLHTRAALGGLGYRVVQAAAVGRFDDPAFLADVRLVDDRHLSRLPSIEADPDTPIIVLSGPRPRPLEDPRITGHLLRPARLASLYPLIQHSLEATPRSAPRVGTTLAARVAQSGRRFVAHLISLSSHGCLLSPTQPIDRGSKLNVEFAVPGYDPFMARALCVSNSSAGYGLRFESTPDEIRASIDDFVTQRLAARPAFA
jgi:hypothetical protein